MKKFLKVDSGVFFGRKPMDIEDSMDMYDLPHRDLSPYKCMSIDGFVDQEFLYEHKQIIKDFLSEGNVVIFCGHLLREWLPGAKRFVPKTIHSFRDYEISIVNEHPIFSGVKPSDMTYNRGVAGFFARGYHPLPDRAEVLLTLPEGEPITYIDRHTTDGTIVVHSGMDLFGYHNTNTTTSRIRTQLIDFIHKEYEILQERRRTDEKYSRSL